MVTVGRAELEQQQTSAAFVKVIDDVAKGEL